MPRRPPRCTSGDKQNDCKGRVIHSLARDDQGHSRHKRQLHHLQWHRPIPTSHALHHPGDASIPIPTCMWRLLSPHGHILPGPGGQIFTLAHRHPIQGRSQGTHPYLTGHLRHLRDPRLNHIRRRTRVRFTHHSSLPQRLERAPQDLISLPSPRQLQGGGRREVYETPHCRQHRPRRHPHRLVPQSHANLPEQPGPGDQIIPGNVRVWTTHPRPPPKQPNQVRAPPHLDRHAKPQRESTVETIYSRKGQMGRAHSRPHATEGRRRRQDTKPGWTPPNQMGQDRDCCRGPTIPPVWGKDRRFRSLNYKEQAIPATVHSPPLGRPTPHPVLPITYIHATAPSTLRGYHRPVEPCRPHYARS